MNQIEAPRVLTRRHSAVVRVTHWINVLCLGCLLLSGLQIFNAHPALYWGAYGADGDPTVLAINAEPAGDPLHGVVRIGGAEIPTTGVLGVSDVDGQRVARAFPAWLTVPSYQDIAGGRRWHFFFAWLFVLNGLVYLGHGLATGHLRRDLLPRREQLSPRHLLADVVDHVRLRFPKGEAARHYNVLQRLAYVGVVVLLCVMVLTGLCMSPGFNAVAPWLVDVFGGRQSARTLHFVSATLIVLFVVVHVAMVVLSGPINNLRSMITGRYAIAKRSDT